MGAAAKREIQAPPVRRDPVPRRANGGFDKFRVMNCNPERHYVAVYKNSDDMGPEYFEALGYDIERLTEHGPRFLVGRGAKQGEPVECQGHVLMSCPNEVRQEIVANGADGVSGQNWVDEIDKKLLKPGGIDAGRGLGAPYMSFENDTRIVEAPQVGVK